MPGQRASRQERRFQILEAARRVAGKSGVRGLTTHRVARAARLSVGLVHFHFGTKDKLVSALLDHLVDHSRRSPRGSAVPASSALAGLVRSEIERHVATPALVELFFEFWLRGASDADIRRRIRQHVSSDLEVFRAAAAASLPKGTRGDAAAVDGLARFGAALVWGGALQSVIDPERFDWEALVTTADDVLQSALAKGRSAGEDEVADPRSRPQNGVAAERGGRS